MISKILKSIKKILKYIIYNLAFKKVTKVRQNGVEFYFETRDKLGEQWNINNEVSISEVQIFEKLKIKEIKNVYYFGAHQCAIPIKIHKIYLKHCNFFCFEAMKKNYEIAKKNIYLNECQNKFNIFNEAISTGNGFEYFDSISLNSFKTNKSLLSTKVKSSDLNSIIEKYGKAELFYFDIEGLEGCVLEKGINLLKTWKNNFFIEAHGINYTSRYNFTNQKLFNLLKSNGYRVYKLKKDFANYDDNFDEINNIENVPEERFYMYAFN